MSAAITDADSFAKDHQNEEYLVKRLRHSPDLRSIKKFTIEVKQVQVKKQYDV
jgi:hypothetical protein